MYINATRGSSAARSVCGWRRQPSGVGARRLAAGASWESRTAGAPWGLRRGHASVVDKTGAIYVIGGCLVANGQCLTYKNDVLASTDGGARPDSAKAVDGGFRGGGGYTKGVLRRY
jgi:hypothetical protein